MSKKSIISTEIEGVAVKVGEEKAVELVAKAGFDAFDLSLMANMIKYDWSTGTARIPDHPFTSSNYLKLAKSIKKVAEDNGIYCNQSHAPFPIYDSLVKDQIKRALEISAEVGSKICVIHPNNYKSPQENAELYAEFLPYAKELGIKIATENMFNWDNNGKFALEAACSMPQNFLDHVKAVNDDYLVACLDIGHAEIFGDKTNAVEMIKTLGKHLQALHIHDNDKRFDRHNLPYLGKIEYSPIIKALKEIDYKGEFTLEATEFLKQHSDPVVALDMAQAAARKIADEFDSL